MLESPKWESKLNKHYYHTKELIQGRKNKGVMKGRTNNPKGRDGMRSGKIIFNEVHQYQTYDNIKVFITGQGKVKNPRAGYFTSNGHVNDGPLDDKLAQGRRILFENEPDNGFLPFICCLPSVDMVHDPENWHMANPSLQYLPALLKQTERNTGTGRSVRKKTATSLPSAWACGQDLPKCRSPITKRCLPPTGCCPN